MDLDLRTRNTQIELSRLWHWSPGRVTRNHQSVDPPDRPAQRLVGGGRSNRLTQLRLHRVAPSRIDLEFKLNVDSAYSEAFNLKPLGINGIRFPKVNLVGN